MTTSEVLPNTIGTRYFTATDVMRLLTFILNNCFVTVGDTLFR